MGAPNTHIEEKKNLKMGRREVTKIRYSNILPSLTRNLINDQSKWIKFQIIIMPTFFAGPQFSGESFRNSKMNQNMEFYIYRITNHFRYQMNMTCNEFSSGN